MGEIGNPIKKVEIENVPDEEPALPPSIDPTEPSKPRVPEKEPA